MAVRIGSARIDENGRAHGGRAGDQTGNEVSTQNWYKHGKGWRVFRARTPAAAERIARCMEMACANGRIGYDQYQRNTLYRQAEPFGFDVSKVTAACETDCSALVRVCCAYAGITGLPEDFRTTNEPDCLLKTGRFRELTGSRYTDQSAYLGRGDILCTRTQGHTVVVLSNGPKYEAEEAPVPAGKTVTVTGGTVNLRAAPGTDARILGVARKGERLAWTGETREAGGRTWYRVARQGTEGWISGKYSLPEM